MILSNPNISIDYFEFRIVKVKAKKRCINSKKQVLQHLFIRIEIPVYHSYYDIFSGLFHLGQM